MNDPVPAAPATPAKSRGGRRPIVGDQALIKQSVRLDAATLAAATELGNGNLSAGLRTAVEMAATAKAAAVDAADKASPRGLAPAVAAAAHDPDAFLRSLGRIL